MSPDPASNGASSTDWIQPAEEQEGLSRYIAVIRERIRIVILALVVTLGAVILYLATATKTYQATAQVVVTPLPAQSQSFFILPTIYQSSDPTRDVETASKLITNQNVAEAVQKKLDLSESPEALLSEVTAEPVASSNFVAVSAKDSDPGQAQAIANAFAEQSVVLQTKLDHQYANQTLPGLREQLNAQPSTADTTQLQQAIAQLETVEASPDPTLRVQTEATLPTAPVSPRPTLSIVGGIFGGLILGLAAAFAIQAIDPKLRREEQLRRLYRLPILTRVPRESRSTGTNPLEPLKLSPAATEAYRTLRGTLVANRRGRGGESRAILVTGSSPVEGKSTTSINLAASLAASGQSVILIEADLRRPSIGKALNLTPQHGVVSVLIESVALQDALITTPVSGANLGLLLADYEGGWISELFSLPAAKKLIEDAKAIADYVIIDSPPITEVIDALPLTKIVDDVLVVTRLGRTKLWKLRQLGELFAENGIKPVGFALIGTPRPARSDYAYYTNSGGSRTRPAGVDPLERPRGG